MQYFAKMQLCPVIFITIKLTVYYASIVLWLIDFVSAVLLNINLIKENKKSICVLSLVSVSTSTIIIYDLNE